LDYWKGDIGKFGFWEMGTSKIGARYWLAGWLVENTFGKVLKAL